MCLLKNLKYLWERLMMLCCVPEGGHAVAGGPAHDEAPLWAGASLTHLLYAARRPHLTHSDLGLHLEMSGRPTEDSAPC